MVVWFFIWHANQPGMQTKCQHAARKEAHLHLHWSGHERHMAKGGKPRSQVLHARATLAPLLQIVLDLERQAILQLIHAVACQLVQVIRLTVQPTVH